MYKDICTLPVFLLILSIQAYAQVETDVDGIDFIPVIKGGSRDIQGAVQTSKGGNFVVAETAQDAINASIKPNLVSISSARFIVLKNGDVAHLASGSADYELVNNPVLSKIEKRKAYIAAYAKAQKNLIEYLEGASGEGKDSLREDLRTLNLAEGMANKIDEELTESNKEYVEGVVRGFVVYDVNDNEAKKTVVVTIVTSPRTRGKYSRVSSEVVKAESLKEGIQELIDELESGFALPVGGKIITTSKGETVFIGFGSDIIRQSNREAIQTRLTMDAVQNADMRAKDALCGIIVGNKLAAERSNLDTQMKSLFEIEGIEDTPEGKLVAQNARNALQNSQASRNVINAARIWQSPPGIQRKAWETEDGWAFAYAIYYPDATQAAANAAEEMRNATILQPIRRPGDNVPGTAPGAQAPTRVPAQQPGRGPSGQVTKDEDL